MAKATKNTKATEAALDAAAESAKDAKKLAKSAPKKDAKKLRSLAEEAKDAASASKKAVKRTPKKVVNRAIAAVAGIAKAIGRVESRRTAAAGSEGGKATAAKKTPSPTKSSATTRALSADDLSSLTVAELKERAQKAGHTGYSRKTKAQLIELLSA